MKGLIYATGDLAPDRDDVDECFAATTAALLRGGDRLRSARDELRCSRRAPAASAARRAGPAFGCRRLARAGFHVISFAGNHCLDWGNDAFAETIGHLRAAGLDVIGAGENIAAARSRRSACSPTDLASPFSRTARSCRTATGPKAIAPGCAPLRAHTHYEQIEHDQPGTPPRIHTFAHAGDLAAMQADIRAARSGRRRARLDALGHPLRARHDRGLPARSGARGDRRRRGRDPGPSRAHPEGHRGDRRTPGVLQPVQLRDRPAHDARTRRAAEFSRDPAPRRATGSRTSTASTTSRPPRDCR